MDFAKTLKKLREANHLTQGQLAKQLKISRPAVTVMKPNPDSLIMNGWNNWLISSMSPLIIWSEVMRKK